MGVSQLHYADINGRATLLFTLNTLGVTIVFIHNMVHSENETSVVLWGPLIINKDSGIL